MSTLVSRGARGAGALGTGVVVSTLIHGSVLAGVILWGLQHDAPRPPVYRVEMVAAPKGVRQSGVVNPPKAEPAKVAEAPSGAERAKEEKSVTTKKAPAATPRATPTPTRSKAAGAKTATPAKTATAPPAAGSREGDKGADVRNLKTEGINFPFPWYLNNIVRQITLQYSPQRVAASLVTELKFIIHRDGSVSGIEIVKSSRDRLFDLEARATVEAVGRTRSFGPLPAEWSDDVLVVYFTFDYALRP